MKYLAFALGLLVAMPAAAHEFTAGDLAIAHPYAFETAPMALAGGGYFSVSNAGADADRLIGIEAPPFRAEIHESYEEGGMHRMRPVEAAEIPPGGELVLAPGGYHVMFLDLGGARFAEGDRIPAVLTFEKAGRVEIVFNVEKRGEAAPAGGHEGHGAPAAKSGSGH